MYTTTGRKLSWKEFENLRNLGEEIFIGNYPKEDSLKYLEYAHKHTMKETEQHLIDEDATLDFMYVDGRPKYYDKWSGECAGIRCKDGWLWN